MKHFLEIFILVVPAVIFKLYRDRNGRKHPDPQGVGLVFLIMWCIITFLSYGHHWTFILKSWLVSITGFGLFFPYAFNWYWYSKNRIFVMSKMNILKYKLYYTMTNLSETAIPDKWFLKYGVHWSIRLLIYIVLFTLSIILFVR